MLTPIEIKTREFKKSVRGYDVKEVKDFLESLADELEHLLNENKGVLEKIATYEKLDNAIKETLVLAQKNADEIKENAQKEGENIKIKAERETEKIKDDAENLLKEAKKEAEGIVGEARQKQEEIEKEIGELEAKRGSFAANFRGLLSSYLEELEKYQKKDNN